MKAQISVLITLIAVSLLLSGRTDVPVTAKEPYERLEPSHNGRAARLSPPAEDKHITFIENVGQFDESVRFQARSDGRIIWLTTNGLWISIMEPSMRNVDARARTLPASREANREPMVRRGVHLKLSFPGSNSDTELEPLRQSDTDFSYYIGDDPSGWRQSVPVWSRVRYRDLYPGLHLELVGGEDGLEMQIRCTVECLSAMEALQLRVEGAQSLSVDRNRLNMTTDIGDIQIPLLVALSADGVPIPSGPPQINGRVVTNPFADVEYVKSVTQSGGSYEDPSDLLYGTYLGGFDADRWPVMTVDKQGSVYVAGFTQSTDIPTTPGAFDTSLAFKDVFVAKLKPDFSNLEYATFLGGNSTESPVGILVDGSGQAYVAGITRSLDFPTTPGAYDSSGITQDTGFLVKLSSNGSSLTYSALVGGAEYVGEPNGSIALNEAGELYFAGNTSTPNFPVTPGAYDTSLNGDLDCFVVKLNSNGSELLYSTFLGGSNRDRARDIVVSDEDDVYVIGETWSPDFPVTSGAFDTSFNGYIVDAFMLKLNATGSALRYSTFLGGASDDIARGIALDNSGRPYVVGDTNSTDFPVTPGAFETSSEGLVDGFVLRFNQEMSNLDYSTFLRGDRNMNDVATAVAVNNHGQAYVAGITWSLDFPTTPGAFDTTLGRTDRTCSNPPCEDAFLTKVNSNGRLVEYSTFFGGAQPDRAHAVFVDSDEHVYLAGDTWSPDLPTTAGAFDSSFGGGDGDFFVAKLAPGMLNLPFPETIGEDGLDRIWSFFDHEYPYGAFSVQAEPPDAASSILKFTGERRDGTLDSCQAGESCYSAHEGVDFTLFPASMRDSEGKVPALAAASGELTRRTASCGGNVIEISHGRYQTTYLHLQNDSYWQQWSSCTSTDPCLVTIGERIGSVGNSGTCTTGTHLHFEVRYDINNDGVFASTERVDPYGWHDPVNPDPWEEETGTPSNWLWGFRPQRSTLVEAGTESVLRTSDGVSVSIPVDAVNSDTWLSYMIVPEPGEAASSLARVRSREDFSTIRTDHTFQLTSVLTDGAPAGSFLQPIEISVAYDDGSVAYVDESSLALYRWDPTNVSWTPLPTTLDSDANHVTSTSSASGIFSLRGAPEYPRPTLSDVSQSLVTRDVETVITVDGSNFLADLALNLDIVTLEVTSVSSSTLTAIVPAGVTVGTYDLLLQNPDNQRAALEDAITIHSDNLERLYLPLIVQ